MRMLVWIVEESWRATVAAAAATAAADDEITLLHVTDARPAGAALVARHGLLGRRHDEEDPSLDVLSEQAAADLLTDAGTLLGRHATRVARRGRVEEEVLATAGGMDVLVLARDGDSAQRGPRSLGRTVRFVVDHAPCAILLVWPDLSLG